MVLADKDIKAYIASGDITISPFDEKNLRAASCYLCSSNTAYAIDDSVEEIDSKQRKQPQKEITIPKEGYLIQPGEFINVKTNEHLKLSDAICGIVSNRGGMAQLGLHILFSSLFVEPGTDNPIALEVQNISKKPIRIYPNQPLVKCIFMLTKSAADQKGRGQDFFNSNNLG